MNSSNHSQSLPVRRAFKRRCVAKLASILCLYPFCSAGAKPEKRPVPDYGGRGGEQNRPSDSVLWIPRAVLFPPYVVTEYLVRRPLGALISGAERARVPEALYNFFMLSSDNKIGWVPTFFVDFGFKPSVGAYFFANDAFARGNDLRLQAATWGTDWLAGSITDRVHVVPRGWLALRASGIRRPDYRYYGEGASSRDRDLSRYAADRVELSGTFHVALGGLSQLETGVGFRKLRFYESSYEHGRSTLARVARGDFSLPEAFDSGYAAGFSRAVVRLDSRNSETGTQTGVRLDLDVEQGSAPEYASRGWLRYGAIAGGFLDLNSRSRVVGMSIAVQFSDPMASGGVPFTELVQLGGNEPMRGFLPGRLLGRSAAVATLSYHWPVWIWLDGTLQAAVGNVFGEHLNDFAPSLLRFSSAIGLRTSGFSDNPVELLVGMGTETFEQHARVTSLRLVLGTSRGF